MGVSKLGKTRGMFHKKLRGIYITKLMARDGASCVLCQEKLNRHIRDPKDQMYVTFDHIIPRSRGGTSDIRNLQLAHQKCNLERGSDPILPDTEGYEWLFMDPSKARI